uniref:BZIP domain-containing protein n=1 Tax=Caenorhabditis tropicalis TaxID=1561998 RepID=A0A1I7UML2_9PELO
MNSAVDPKMNPKYREKRAKNNEAAKKSRKARKDRESATMKENTNLKIELKEARRQAAESVDQMQKIANEFAKTTTELEYYKQEYHRLQTIIEQQPYPLRDVTNRQKYEAKEYVTF